MSYLSTLNLIDSGYTSPKQTLLNTRTSLYAHTSPKQRKREFLVFSSEKHKRVNNTPTVINRMPKHHQRTMTLYGDAYIGSSAYRQFTVLITSQQLVTWDSTIQLFHFVYRCASIDYANKSLQLFLICKSNVKVMERCGETFTSTD